MGTSSVYYLPSIEALFKYLRAVFGYHICSTWIAAFKAGNYVSWTGLAFDNDRRHCPMEDETITCRMIQNHSNLLSTQPKMKKSDIIGHPFKGDVYDARQIL